MERVQGDTILVIGYHFGRNSGRRDERQRERGEERRGSQGDDVTTKS